jgi:hypothetical protein
MADDKAQGLLEPGNIDLYNRPSIPNPKGGQSTVYSTSFGDDKGREILVPRAADGKILSEKEAEQRYYKTGEHLGIFDNPDHATAYATQLHNDYAAGKYTKKPMADNSAAPNTVPVIAPDGTKWDIPHDQVPGAVQNGGKLGVDMIGPDDKPYLIPMDNVHSAIAGGGRLAPPPLTAGVPNPNMQTSTLGTIYDRVVNGPSGASGGPLPNPKIAGATEVADNVSQDTIPNRIATGALKGGLQTAHTLLVPAGKVVQAATGSTSLPTSFKQPSSLEPEGTAENIGAGAEGIMEFMGGDEALKGLSIAEKLGLGAKIAKLAEESPAAGKIIQAGLKALRIGSVGTAQGLAHGESLPDAAKAGAVSAGTGAVLEGASGLVSKFAPQVKRIAGEAIPVRASQSSGLADAAENIAPSSKLREFDVNKTQPAAKRAIGNVASDIGSKEIGGQTLASSAKNLEQRAAQIKAQSSPIFEKLDDLTKNEPVKFTDLQKQERAAFRQGDIETANKSRVAQENILNRYQSQFAPDDYSNARTNWKQASALEQAHDALNSKGVVTSTPVKFRPVGAPDPGYIKGKNFANTVLALRDDGTLAQAGLSPKHVQALQDIGTTLEKSADVHKLHPLIRLVEATAGAAPAGTGFAASHFLGSLMTNEKLAENVAALLRSGAGPAAASQTFQRGKAALGDGSDYDYDPNSKNLVSSQTQ